MKTFTSCAACGQPLQVLNEFQTHHPTCETGPDAAVLYGHLRDLLAAARSNNLPAFKQAASVVFHDDGPPRLHDAALIYADWGWPVFPCKPGDKTPATGHGFRDATTDTSQIRQWWVENPRYNIGLATGHWFDVVDVDLPEGPIHLAGLLESGLIPESHGQACTASGGQHILVPPTGATIATALRPGIDYRGMGGYIVAPPSEVDGRRYRWTVRPSPVIRGS